MLPHRVAKEDAKAPSKMAIATDWPILSIKKWGNNSCCGCESPIEAIR